MSAKSKPFSVSRPRRTARSGFPSKLRDTLELRDVVGDYSIRYRDGRNEVLNSANEVVAEGSGNFCLGWALEATAIRRKGGAT